VVLRRGGETFEVLLNDPSKPRQAATPGVQSPEAGAPGRPVVGRPTTGTPPQPGPGLRAPGRPRVPPPPPPTSHSSDGQEPNEED
jgi:hypothetical protein